MSANTRIEWADHTFNPWVGCTKVGPGCDHCYAEGWAKRAGSASGVVWGSERRRTSVSNWNQPLRWDAQAAKLYGFSECPGCGWRGATDVESSRLQVCEACGTRMVTARPRVFCASLADVFDNQVPPEWRADLFRLIANTPHLDWLLLTKRIGNARTMIAEAAATVEFGDDGIAPWTSSNPWPNVWVGATVVNQDEADRDIPKLLATPACVRFLSVEPMLGPISLDGWPIYGEDERRMIAWVICGGESGPHARPMHPDWARSLRNQCAAACVPFLFKQWGEWGPRHELQAAHPGISGKLWHAFDPDTSVCRIGKKDSGRLLDGMEHNGFPSEAEGAI